MSLLSNPRHMVWVQLRKKGPQGSLGQDTLVPDGAPIMVRGNVHPARAEEILARGLQEDVVRRFVGRTWPGDFTSLIYFDGYEWEQNPTEYFDISPSTTHYEVVLIRRGRADVPGL